MFRLALGLIDRADPGGARRAARAQRLLAATAALGFALAPGIVLSCNRPEVYALATALALGALAGGLLGGSARIRWWARCWWGWA